MSALKKILLNLVLVILTAILAILAAAVVYRSVDHGERLLSRKIPLAGSELELLSGNGRYSMSAFHLTDSLGRVARGRLRMPLEYEGPLPIVLVLGGLGTGERAAGIIPLDEPVLLVALDYPEAPLDPPGLLQVPQRIGTLNEAVLQAVGSGFLALDFLCSLPQADTSRVSVLGASFGAPFAVIAGALDCRIKAVVLLQAAENMGALIDWNLRRRIPSPLLRRPLSWLLGSLAAPYEPGNHIDRIAPRPVLLVNSLQDEKIPRNLAEALREKAGPSAEQVWLDSGHLHPSHAELIDTLTMITANWLKRHGLL